MKKEKLMFILIAVIFSVSIFVVSVLASSRISAKLSGAFNFSVPDGEFFLEISGSVEGSKDSVDSFEDEFNHINKTKKTWSPELKFKENNLGEIEDIIFVFKVTNKNELKDGKGRVRVGYVIGEIDDEITLTPDERLSNNLIVLEPISNFEDPEQTNNKAEFQVVLSPKNKIPTNNINSAKFNFNFEFEFVA